MESAGLHAQSDSKNSENEIPRFTVDLSKPPEQRYNHIVDEFREQICALPAIFDELLETVVPRRLTRPVRRLARILLRRLYDREETQELKGLSKATGVDMFLLVAFNVLLDALMGCTSGGVRVKDRGAERSKLVHFRALDWGMDPLRKVTCQLDFIREPGGPVIAQSITYFGYVGVLTGVKKGLSISLNFRPHHDTSTWYKNLLFFWHCLLVLLGFRRSVSSLLRQYLLPKQEEPPQQDISAEIEPLPSTAAYLIFCTPQEAISIEKDNYTARVYRDKHFLVTLNHDNLDEQQPEVLEKAQDSVVTADVTGMEDLVSFSIERKECTMKLWKKAVKSKSRSDGDGPFVRMRKVVEWMEGDDIVNEQTHYAAIMDPEEGRVVWAKMWPEPVLTDDSSGVYSEE